MRFEDCHTKFKVLTYYMRDKIDCVIPVEETFDDYFIRFMIVYMINNGRSFK